MAETSVPRSARAEWAWLTVQVAAALGVLALALADAGTGLLRGAYAVACALWLVPDLFGVTHWTGRRFGRVPVLILAVAVLIRL